MCISFRLPTCVLALSKTFVAGYAVFSCMELFNILIGLQATGADYAMDQFTKITARRADEGPLPSEIPAGKGKST